MEANYREPCDFKINRLGEKWRITGCWRLQYDNSTVWFDGECFRNGVKFHRIFRPSDVPHPGIILDVDGTKEAP